MLSGVIRTRGLTESIAEFEASPALFAIGMRTAMDAGVVITKAAIQQLTPARSGRMRGSWDANVIGLGVKLAGIVGAPNPAHLVENDTKAHEILPRKAKALLLPVINNYAVGMEPGFRSVVHHPGTRGRHMAKIGLQIARPTVMALFRGEIQIVLRTIRGATP